MSVRFSGLWFWAAVCSGALGAACDAEDAESTGTGGAGSTLGGATGQTGGAQGIGGSAATGGGVVSSGGSLATGGVAPMGGALSTGGGAPLGGATSTGGAAPTGGTQSTGGAAPTGGTQSTGGDPGQPPFKGVANSPAAEIAALGATWCYNWGASPESTDCDDPLFVPMVWGGGDVEATIQRISNAGYTTVLGFNEPNKDPPQSDMSVAEAIGHWPAMTSNPNLRVGSPAVSDDGRAWLEEFMDQVEANGLRVDFIAMHWYGWNTGSCVVSQLEGAVRWAEQWGRPIWITEFGCMGSSNADEQTLLDFFPAAVAMLQNHPLVERYAWYPWNTYNHLYLPDENDVRTITPLGELFSAAPAYR